jgi:hypothetical protein
LGIAVNSLGDEPKVVLEKVKFNVCLISPVELKFGITIEPIEKPFHLEIPAVKELLLVNGLVIAELAAAGTKGKEFKYTLKGTKGDQQSALKCEALKQTFTHSYALAKDTASADEHASWNSSFTLKFEKKWNSRTDPLASRLVPRYVSAVNYSKERRGASVPASLEISLVPKPHASYGPAHLDHPEAPNQGLSLGPASGNVPATLSLHRQHQNPSRASPRAMGHSPPTSVGCRGHPSGMRAISDGPKPWRTAGRRSG